MTRTVRACYVVGLVAAALVVMVAASAGPGVDLASMLRAAHYLRLDKKADEAIALLLEIRKVDPRFGAEFPDEGLKLEDASAVLADCYELKAQWADALPLWEEVLQAHRDAQVPPVHIERCRGQLAAQGALLQPVALVKHVGALAPPDMDIQSGVSLVTLRSACERAGASVIWHGATQSVTATLGEKSITFAVGSDMAVGNGDQIALRVAPYLNEEWRMVVPLRPLVEALGGTVEWEPEAQIVYVTLPLAASSQTAEEAAATEGAAG